jgi:hypothetical protein
MKRTSLSFLLAGLLAFATLAVVLWTPSTQRARFPRLFLSAWRVGLNLIVRASRF